MSETKHTTTKNEERVSRELLRNTKAAAVSAFVAWVAARKARDAARGDVINAKATEDAWAAAGLAWVAARDARSEAFVKIGRIVQAARRMT